MKKLVFKNGKEIAFMECYSASEYVQGAEREVLDFRFDASQVSLDEIDKLFTSEECSRLAIRETVGEQTEEFIHENYGVRVALSKQRFTLATENGVEEVEQISVKMAQYTVVEMQMISLTETVDVLVMESLLG